MSPAAGGDSSGSSRAGRTAETAHDRTGVRDRQRAPRGRLPLSLRPPRRPSRCPTPSPSCLLTVTQTGWSAGVVSVLAQVSVLEGCELRRVATVHAESLDRVSGGERRQGRGVPHRQPRVLRGVPGTYPRLVVR